MRPQIVRGGGLSKKSGCSKRFEARGACLHFRNLKPQHAVRAGVEADARRNASALRYPGAGRGGCEAGGDTFKVSTAGARGGVRPP